MSEYAQKMWKDIMEVFWRYSLLYYMASIAIIDSLLFRFGVRDGFCRSKARMDGKTVVITGAETGIGKATARELSKRGARIVMGSYDYETGLKTAAEISSETGNELVVHKLDLGSLMTVQKFANKVLDTEPKIHVLINNAATIFCPEGRTDDGIERHFGVNFLGHFYLTNLLLDRLKESKPARIVDMASVGHYSAWIHFDDLFLANYYSPSFAYHQSKLAVLMASQELAERTKGMGVTVYAVDPGLTGQTQAGQHRFKSYGWLMQPIVLLIYIYIYFCKSPLEGCQTALYCAIDESAGRETGLYYRDCLPTTPSWISRNKESRKRLLDVASQMIHQKIQNQPAKNVMAT